MTRKAHIIAILALGLTATLAGTSPAVGRFVTSARDFQRNCREWKNSGGSLSPVERFVFSLILANTKTPHASTQAPGAAPERRT